MSKSEVGSIGRTKFESCIAGTCFARLAILLAWNDSRTHGIPVDESTNRRCKSIRALTETRGARAVCGSMVVGEGCNPAFGIECLKQIIGDERAAGRAPPPLQSTE